MNKPPTSAAKPRYSLTESAQLLGISERQLRTRISEGAIESHLDGTRRFISSRALNAYIARLEKEHGSGVSP